MSKKDRTRNEGSKKSSFLIILILLAAVAATGVAGYFWYQLEETKAQLSEGGAPEIKRSALPVAPIYIPLEAFTVSLMSEKNEEDRVLHIGLMLKVSDERSKSVIEKLLPDIRSKLIVMLSRHSYAELASKEGKALLIGLITEEVNKTLYENQSAKVDDVLLNAFILR